MYDGSFFANVTELDYCSPSGFSDPQKKNLDQSSTWSEGRVTANHGGHATRCARSAETTTPPVDADDRCMNFAD